MVRQRKIDKILVTGGAGFIGSEFIRRVISQRYKIVVVDNLSYSGDLKRIKSVYKDISFYKCDILSSSELEKIFKNEKIDIVIQFAAETHVDRSLKEVDNFIKTNILGTQNLIKLSLKYKPKKFVHISTDEVYGQSLKGRFKEDGIIKPHNPYAVTKASAEQLVRVAIESFGLNAVIVRPCNTYGLWQHPEKFIPVAILSILKGRKIPVYGQGVQIREWLHVSDCVRGILTVLDKGHLGEVYNIGSNVEKSNLETASILLKLMNRDEKLIHFVADRPGHDYRYGINSSKLRSLGWKPEINFLRGLKQTIEWYSDNLEWVNTKLDK